VAYQQRISVPPAAASGMAGVATTAAEYQAYQKQYQNISGINGGAAWRHSGNRRILSISSPLSASRHRYRGHSNNEKGITACGVYGKRINHWIKLSSCIAKICRA